MAEPGDTIRLVELICARLCHDLGGLIGTVGNALDMVTEDAGRDNEVLAFASSAANALTQRLRLMRTAWGPESDTIALPALVQLVTPALAARRVRLDTASVPDGCEFPPPIGRVVLNLIVLACDCLPRGGTIMLLGKPADLLVRIVGAGAAWPPGFSECMVDEAAALAALTNALSVQMPLTALFAQSGGLRLSPVLGPAGIEALRLGPGQGPNA
jgi:histidine phosphotransferase ChpT